MKRFGFVMLMAALLAGCSKSDNGGEELFEEPDEEYIILKIGNSTTGYTYTDVSVHYDANSQHHGITWKSGPGGDEIGYITWQGQSTGTHEWDWAETQFWWEPRDREEGAFFNSFVGDLNQRPSGGSITIHQFGAVGEFVTGTFVLADAGLRVPDDQYLGASRITGEFKVRRNE